MRALEVQDADKMGGRTIFAATKPTYSKERKLAVGTVIARVAASRFFLVRTLLFFDRIFRATSLLLCKMGKLTGRRSGT